MYRSEVQSSIVLRNEADYFMGASNDFLNEYSTTSPNTNPEKFQHSNTLEVFKSNPHDHKSGFSTEDENYIGRYMALPTNSSLHTFHVKDLDYTELEGSSESLQKENSCSIASSSSKISPVSYSQNSESPKELPRSISTSIINDSEQYIEHLIPKIYQVSPQTYGILLSETLRDWSQDINLDDFYNLLYNYNVLDDGSESASLEGSIKSNSNRKSVEICKLIVETFGSSYKSSVPSLMASTKCSQFSLVNFEEFLKTFLALKILFDLIEEADESSKLQTTIPRISIYNAYCIICQKLDKRHRRDSKLSGFHSNTIVGNAKFGRLIKLVYPKLKIRRLGRRGNSRHHYLGVTWNKSNIDPDTFSQISGEESFQSFPRKQQQEKVGYNNPNLDILKEVVNEKNPKFSLSPYNEMVVTSLLDYGMANSSYSFVCQSSKFPEPDCSPRIWNFFPGKLPIQSSWSLNTMYKSVSVLKKYNIDMKSFFQNFLQEVFSPMEMKNFLASFIEKMNVLINSNSDKEGYMHLYLIILHLLFPVILSCDEEVSVEEKKKLRKNLIWFIERINTTIPKLPNRERCHFINFSNILKKMVQVNKLTSSQINIELTKGIAEEMAADFQRKVNFEVEACEINATEDIISRAVIVSSKAFPSAFAVEDTDFIVNIIKAFVKFAVIGTENLLEISKPTGSQHLECQTWDLPFQLFRNSAQLFHQICLSDPFVLKLPIQVINCIVIFIHKELHSVSFDNFGKRNHELSKNTFKTWWVNSTLGQEYMQILSEIVGLGEQLSGVEC